MKTLQLTLVLALALQMALTYPQVFSVFNRQLFPNFSFGSAPSRPQPIFNRFVKRPSPQPQPQPSRFVAQPSFTSSFNGYSELVWN